MAGNQSKSKKTVEEQLDMVLNKLEEMNGQINDLKDNNKTSSVKLEDIKHDNKNIEKQLVESGQ